MAIFAPQYEPGILINIYNLPKNFTGYQAREYLSCSHSNRTIFNHMFLFASRPRYLAGMKNERDLFSQLSFERSRGEYGVEAVTYNFSTTKNAPYPFLRSQLLESPQALRSMSITLAAKLHYRSVGIRSWMVRRKDASVSSLIMSTGASEKGCKAGVRLCCQALSLILE